ncbi:MAG: outer membrane protein TolC [Planctomycetota bacterium]
MASASVLLLGVSGCAGLDQSGSNDRLDQGEAATAIWQSSRTPSDLTVDKPASGGPGEANTERRPTFGLDPTALGSGPAGRLDLATALAMARTAALSIEAARERTRGAEERLTVARRAAWPTIELGARYESLDGSDQPNNGSFIDVNRQNLTLGPALRLVFEPGPALFAARRAKAELGVVRGNEELAQLNAIGEASERWCDWTMAVGQETVAQAAVEQADAFVDDAKARLDSGAGLALDVQRAAAQLSAARRFQIQAEAASSIARLRLGELLRLEGTLMDGRLVPGSLAVSFELSTLETAAPAIMEEWIEEAIFRHPALRSAVATDLALAAREDEASDAWMLPRIELFAQHGGFGEDLDSLQQQERIAAAVTWAWSPALPAQARAARATRRAARADAQAQALAIETAVRLAMIRGQAARATRTAAATEITSARAAHRMALEQLNAGAGLFLDVLNAEFALRSAELAAMAAEVELSRSRVAVLVASGLDPTRAEQ